MCQLKTFCDKNGAEFEVGGRSFRLEGISGDGDIVIATLSTKRTSYSAIRCNNTRVAGHPDAEAWSVISASGRTVADFAVIGDSIKRLA